MSILAFDIEANGLRDATTIHCVVTQDVKTGEVCRYRDPHDAWSALCAASQLVAHNGIAYDIPTLARITGNDAEDLPPCFDTFVAANLLWSDRSSRKTGTNSLEAWGDYLRIPKADPPTDWSVWTQYMEDYCAQDVTVTVAVYKHILPHAKKYQQSLKLEHSFATVIQKQVDHGFLYDQHQAQCLTMDLVMRRNELQDELKAAFPDEIQEMKTAAYYEDGETGARYGTKGEASRAGASPSTLIQGPNKVKRIPFNPNSRDQIAQRFIDKYGWQPTERTPGGKPKIDEAILDALPYPEAELLSELLLIGKRLSQIDQWDNYVESDNRIHGSVMTNGAVSGRCTHSKPNMAQVPSSRNPYGEQCRRCFIVPEGCKLVGIDASSLELRMLAHELAAYDGGEYAQVAVHGDIHTYNQKKAGCATRDDAKTFFYAFCYGAGWHKLGTVVGVDDSEILPLLMRKSKARTAEKILSETMPGFTRRDVATAIKGGVLKDTFLSEVSGLQDLINDVKNAGVLYGLDGRPLLVRTPHMALNTKLQSHGAVLMKHAAVTLAERIRELRLRAHFVANIHDEWQIESAEEDAETVGQLGVQCIRDAGVHFGLRCPMDGEYKVGNNWSETH